MESFNLTTSKVWTFQDTKMGPDEAYDLTLLRESLHWDRKQKLDDDFFSLQTRRKSQKASNPIEVKHICKKGKGRTMMRSPNFVFTFYELSSKDPYNPSYSAAEERCRMLSNQAKIKRARKCYENVSELWAINSNQCDLAAFGISPPEMIWREAMEDLKEKIGRLQMEMSDLLDKIIQ